MKHIVITGANRGIGLELSKQFLAHGNQVSAICRKASAELKQLDLNLISDIDLSEPGSIEKLSKQISKPIDILINNAGIWFDEQLEQLPIENFRQAFQVNTLAPLFITNALLEHLHHGSKVIMITSRMGSIADNSSGGRYSYRMSKAALNAAAKSLSIDLKPKGIWVGVIHPGHVATDMGGTIGIPVSESVQGIIERIQQCDASNTGQFFHANGQELPW